jgi:hypothetical protein
MATKRKPQRRRKLRIGKKKPTEQEVSNNEAVPEEEALENIRRARTILTKKKEEQPVVDEPVEEIIDPPALPEPGKVVFSTSPMTDVLEELEIGHAVVITHEEEDKFSMRLLESDEFSVKRTLTTEEYINIVYTKEYKAFEVEWQGMDTDERLDYADANDIDWVEHDNHRINMMRLSQAVREYRNITKYKDEWNTKSKRAKIRPKR